MFSVPTKNKTALFAMFSLPRAPKSSQNIGFYDVLATAKNASVAKTPLFATLWQHNMSEMLYFTVFWNTFSKTLVFTVFCENTCTKHRKYQRIQRLHFPWQQATNSKNTAIYSVSAQWFFQENVLFGPFLASETSQDKEGGGTPPPPFHILNFEIFTKSKTLQFLELKTRPEPHFLTVFTMFFARA